MRTKFSLLLFTVLFVGHSDAINASLNTIPALQSRLASVSGNDTASVNVCNELSKQYGMIDSTTSAMQFAQRALQLAQASGYNYGMAIAYSRIAVVYNALGNYPASLQYNLQSLKLFEALSDVNNIELVLNNIGSIYYQQGDYDMAISYYKKIKDGGMHCGLTFSNMGVAYVGKNKPMDALNYFKRALECYSLQNDSNNIGNIFTDIGNVYQQQGNYASAIKYYRNALRIKQHTHDAQGQCDALGSLGDTYSDMGNYKIAISYEDSSLYLSSAIGYISCMQVTEQALSKIYDKMRDSSIAYRHYKAYITLRDSMYNEENTKRTVREQMNYDFDKRIQVQRAEQDKKDAVMHAVIWSTSAGLFMAILLSLWIYRGYRNKRIANAIISEQKKTIEEKQKELLASIRYAQRIQQSLLPTDGYIHRSINKIKLKAA